MPPHLTSSADHPILVTGGAGFLGRFLVRRLLEAGHHVHVFDDLSTGRRDHVPDDPRVGLTVGSILDEDSVRSVLAEVRPRCIVHFAAIVGVRLAHDQPGAAYRISVDGTRVLLEHSDVPVVLASSSAVYGLTAGERVHEDAALDREDIAAYDGGKEGYALGKWELEEQGREAAAAGRPVFVARFFNVVGPHQTGRYGMVIPTFVRLALAGEPLVVHDDGEQTRCFSDVRVAMDAMVRLLERDALWNGRAINIGNDRPDSIGALARIVVEETGSDSAITFQPYGEIFPGRKDVRGRRPHTGRLQEELGEVRWPELRDIVRDVVAVEQARG